MAHLIVLVVLFGGAFIAAVIEIRRGRARSAERIDVPADPGPPAPTAPKQAIIVHRSPTLRAHIGHVLEEHGYLVVEAENEAEASSRLDELVSASPSLVALLHCDGSEADDLLFVKALRANPAYQGVRVVLMTSGRNADQAAMARAVGVHDCLTEPFGTEALLDVVDRL